MFIIRSVKFYPDWVCTAGDRTPDDPSHPATDWQLPVRIPRVYTTGPRTDVWRVWIGADVVWTTRDKHRGLETIHRVQWIWWCLPSNTVVLGSCRRAKPTRQSTVVTVLYRKLPCPVWWLLSFGWWRGATEVHHQSGHLPTPAPAHSQYLHQSTEITWISQ